LRANSRPSSSKTSSRMEWSKGDK